MSEMSLYEQVKTIDNVIAYFAVVDNELKALNEEIEKELEFIRQRGLRTETITVIKTKMLHINDELGEIMSVMGRGKLYLENVREKLSRTGNEK